MIINKLRCVPCVISFPAYCSPGKLGRKGRWVGCWQGSRMNRTQSFLELDGDGMGCDAMPISYITFPQPWPFHSAAHYPSDCIVGICTSHPLLILFSSLLFSSLSCPACPLAPSRARALSLSLSPSTIYETSRMLSSLPTSPHVLSHACCKTTPPLQLLRGG